MAHIFVSYSRVDTEITERLVDRLRRVYGLSNVWYDDGLLGGDHWWQEILHQINECDVFVYLLSNESVMSPYCHAEFTEARRLQKPIVTVQVRDRTQLSSELSEIQYVDMKQGINDSTLARLIGSINKQQELPKKRRALWTPVTPLPEVPSTEKTPASQDIDTPPLQLNRSQDTSSGDQRTARATIIAAIIGGIAVVAAAVIAIVLPMILNGSAHITPTPVTQAAALATLTEAVTLSAPVMTIAPSDTVTPSAAVLPGNTPDFVTLTPNSSPTLVYETTAEATGALGFAGNLVKNNGQWVYDPNINQNKKFFEGFEMVLVPAGCFNMGDSSMPNIGDGGQQCFNKPFYIGASEMTNEQFSAFGCTAAQPSHWTDILLPRESITWFEANACAAKFAETFGGHWRLPTEAEWEYAARGPSDFVYPWGNQWEGMNLAWSGDANNHTTSVSSYEDDYSWVGAYGMAGNVMEWTSTLAADYPYKVDAIHENMADKTHDRVVRGGSFLTDQAHANSEIRTFRDPNSAYQDVGFRLVMDAP